MMAPSFMAANTHMEPVLHASKLPVDHAPGLQQSSMLAPNDGSLAHSTNAGIQRRVSVLHWRTSQTQAPQHQRPQLTTEYAPSPAPGSTVAAVSKKILRRQHLEQLRPREGDQNNGPFPASPPRLETSGSNTNNVRLVHYAGMSGCLSVCLSIRDVGSNSVTLIYLQHRWSKQEKWRSIPIRRRTFERIDDRNEESSYHVETTGIANSMGKTLKFFITGFSRTHFLPLPLSGSSFSRTRPREREGEETRNVLKILK